MRENIPELRAQFDQELADLRYEREGLHDPLVVYDSYSEASCESLYVACELLKAHRSASVSFRFRQESDLSSGLGEFLMRSHALLMKPLVFIVVM